MTNKVKPMSDYQRISCELYDELELKAIRKNPIRIVYVFDGLRHSITDTITTLTVKENAEWLHLKQNKPIRLDSILEVDDISFRK